MIEFNGVHVNYAVGISGCPGILVILLGAADCLWSFSSIFSLSRFILLKMCSLLSKIRCLFQLILTVTISSSLFTSGNVIRYLIFNVQNVYHS